MKWVVSILLAGLIPLYFLLAAFKLHLDNWEIVIHIAIRFFLGFTVLGIFVLHEQTLKFKNSIFIIIALVLADDIADYIRHVDTFTFQFKILGVYMLIWGALTGYVFMRQIRNRESL